ncbi:MAG: LysR family transcriptional regulator [Sedimentitalea sp.]
MPKSLPPLTWFRAFDSAARHLSFTAAAGELGLTQSAISQHVRALELRLGTQLFVRRPRGLALTDAGRTMVPDVAAAMARLGAATEPFLPTSAPDVIKIATSASVARWIIAPGLGAFQRVNPGQRVHLISTVWPDDFAAAQADVEIRFGARDVVGAGAELLHPNGLVAVMAPQLGAAGDLSVLRQVPLIQPVGLSTSWAQICRKLGQGDGAAAVFVDTHGLAVDLAVNGAGVALTHALIAAPALAQRRLVQLSMPEQDAVEGYYLATHSRGDGAARFMDWFKAQLV